MSTTAQKISFTSEVGGSLEITNSDVTIYRINGANPDPLFAKNVDNPNFSIDLTVDSDAYYYVTMDVKSYNLNGQSFNANADGIKVTLVAAFTGNDRNVAVTSQSTIATTFAFNRMITVTSDGELLISETAGTSIAYGMKNNFIHADGTIAQLIASSPNGLETNSYPMFNYLSSMLYYCLTDYAIYTTFTALTNDNQYISGLMNMIRNPFDHVKDIYDLISNKSEIYSPSLSTLTLPSNKSRIPDQWTLTIKANLTGAKNFIGSGLAFVVFDKDNKAWITNNFRAGTGNSGTHCIVLNADTTPCSFSPLTGGGILGTAFGAAVHPNGERIAFGNFGWGPKEYNPQNGSISVFSYDGTPQSPPEGYVNKTSRIQGMAYDKDGNLWLASMGTQQPLAPDTPAPVFDFPDQNSAIVVYRKGNPNDAVSFENFLGTPSPFHQTFDVAFDSQGYAYVANMGTKDGQISSVYKMKLTATGLEPITYWTSSKGYESLRQISVNSKDEIFVGAIASNQVFRLNTDLIEQMPSLTTNINGPWGVNIDREDTIFACAFAQEKGRQSDGTLDMHGPFGVTVVKNGDDSNAKFMTLPTGGDQVMLANGQPLYGTRYMNDPNGTIIPSYEPLMRLTATNTDRAGNLWCVNNWKPSAYTDIHSDPGGEGVVIFLGVAAPAV